MWGSGITDIRKRCRGAVRQPAHARDHRSPGAFCRSRGGTRSEGAASLNTAANAAGFKEVAFQYEPIAAALDNKSRITDEQIVLVADIGGGGTSDFSLLRVGPACHGQLERRDDILANHGFHVPRTGFYQSVNLAA